MTKNTFGKIMGNSREKFDINQTIIYEGICSAASYQRAETQERDVDFILLETLLARVGQKAENFELILSDEDWELRERRLAMRAAFFGKNFTAIEQMIPEYRKAIKRYKHKESGKHRLHEQFCLYYEMKIAQGRQEDTDIICQLAWNALSLTKDCEQKPHSKQNLYTLIELDLLLTLVQYRYGKWENVKDRETCLLDILNYAELYTSTESREDIQGRAWIELLKTMEPYAELKELLSYINQAIACFSGGTGIGRLGEVHFMKAKLLKQMDDETACKEECKMAYSIFEVLEWNTELKEVIDYCEEVLKWHITTQI